MLRNKTCKIIAICMSIVLCTTLCASAAEMNDRAKNILSDLVDMDRVYEYDLRVSDKDEEKTEDTAEQITNKNAVWSAVTLGLMDYQTGNLFNEDKTVPFNEFASVIIRFSVGKNTGFEEAYMNYGETRPTTMGEAVSYLLGALGYSEEFFGENTSNTKYSVASRIGVLDSVAYSESKHLTRGEFAQLLYNCLEIPLLTQVVYSSDKVEYEKSEDKTILSERFGLFSVNGTCTAQYGQDIYTDVYYDANLIGIDRGMFDAKNIKTDDILGHRVLAYAKEGNGRNYELVAITLCEDDEAVSFGAHELEYVNSGRIAYDTGDGAKTVNISKVERVVYNGKIYDVSKLNDSSLYNISGKILVSKNKDGAADTVIINSYRDYIVKSVSSYTERITLKDGLTFNGNPYIEFADSDDIAITVTKNGKAVAYTDLQPGDVISVMETANPNHINIIACDNKVNGSISLMYDEIIEIGNTSFRVSESYEDANDINQTYPKLEVGLNGIFSVSYDGRIVAFSSGSGYRYGYLKAVGETGNGLNKSYAARMFTMDGEWVSLELAEKLTLDGIKNVTNSTAYTIIGTNCAEACYAVVRYETNLSKQIVFLDTAIDNPEEKSDISAIRKSDTWNNKFSWTVSSSRIDLLYSKYWLSQQTVVFNVPLDKDKENQYTVLLKPQFISESKGNLQLYSPDDFFNVPVVESFEGGGSSGSSFFAMYITNIGKTLNDDGEIVYVLRGANAVSQSKWEESKLITTYVMTESGLSCKVGDIIQYTSSGSKLIDYQTIITKEEIDANMQKRPNSGGSPEYMFAEVVDVDSARKFIKASINGNEYVFYSQSAGICDSSTGKVENVSVGEYVQGDKIFMIGATDYMRTLVIR